jgi:hypothetical protein
VEVEKVAWVSYKFLPKTTRNGLYGPHEAYPFAGVGWCAVIEKWGHKKRRAWCVVEFQAYLNRDDFGKETWEIVPSSIKFRKGDDGQEDHEETFSSWQDQYRKSFGESGWKPNDEVRFYKID